MRLRRRGATLGDHRGRLLTRAGSAEASIIVGKYIGALGFYAAPLAADAALRRPASAPTPPEGLRARSRARFAAGLPRDPGRVVVGRWRLGLFFLDGDAQSESSPPSSGFVTLVDAAACSFGPARAAMVLLGARRRPPSSPLHRSLRQMEDFGRGIVDSRRLILTTCRSSRSARSARPTRARSAGRPRQPPLRRRARFVEVALLAPHRRPPSTTSARAHYTARRLDPRPHLRALRQDDRPRARPRGATSTVIVFMLAGGRRRPKRSLQRTCTSSSSAAARRLFAAPARRVRRHRSRAGAALKTRRPRSTASPATTWSKASSSVASGDQSKFIHAQRARRNTTTPAATEGRPPAHEGVGRARRRSNCRALLAVTERARARWSVFIGGHGRAGHRRLDSRRSLRRSVAEGAAPRSPRTPRAHQRLRTRRRAGRL